MASDDGCQVGAPQSRQQCCPTLAEVGGGLNCLTARQEWEIASSLLAIGRTEITTLL
jgi:hypothetical protein